MPGQVSKHSQLLPPRRLKRLPLKMLFLPPLILLPMLADAGGVAPEPTEQSSQQSKLLRRYVCWRHSSLPWAQRQLKRRMNPQFELSFEKLGWEAGSSHHKRGSRALSADLLKGNLGRAWTEQGYYAAKAAAEAQRQTEQREFAQLATKLSRRHASGIWKSRPRPALPPFPVSHCT